MRRPFLRARVVARFEQNREGEQAQRSQLQHKANCVTCLPAGTQFHPVTWDGGRRGGQKSFVRRCDQGEEYNRKRKEKGDACAECEPQRGPPGAHKENERNRCEDRRRFQDATDIRRTPRNVESPLERDVQLGVVLHLGGALQYVSKR